MNKFVLDASALLAYLQGEPGHQRVAEILDKSVISTVNISETIQKMIEKGWTKEEADKDLKDLNPEIMPFQYETALLTADLREQTKSLGLSLGDRACIALGIQLKLSILTTDKIWSKLKIKNKIEVIR